VVDEQPGQAGVAGRHMVFSFALGTVASLVAVSVLADFVLSNRRDQLGRHESVRTHYRRLVLTH
jgi:sulfite exporter TauE/SafE